MTDKLAPPSAPLMTEPPPSPLAPPDDIADPAVPPATLAALTAAPPPAAPEAPPPVPYDYGQHEALFRGAVQYLTQKMDGQVTTFARDASEHLHTLLYEVKDRLAKASDQNEHVLYQFAHALAQLQERGVQCRTAPYTVQVQSCTPEGYQVTFTAQKDDVETLFAALSALVAWLAQQGYQGVTTGVA